MSEEERKAKEETIRQLLRLVDILEKSIGKSPTTAEIRRLHSGK